MVNILSRLPNEVLLMVLKEAPNLASLHSLVCTHPLLQDMFESNSVRVIEAVIKATLPDELQAFPRWLAILGSLKAPESTYDPGHSRGTTLGDFYARYRALHPSPVTSFVPQLPLSLVGTKGPRYALAAASRIRRLEDMCLVHMVDNVDGMELAYPDDPDFEFQNFWATKQFPPSTSFSNSDTRTPSWVERQRVGRALWQLMISWQSYAAFKNQQPTDNPLPLRMGDIREHSEFWRQTFLDHTDVHTGLFVGEWLRPYFQGDVLDSVNDTLRQIMGCSPTKFFTADLGDKGMVRVADRLSTTEGKLATNDTFQQWRTYQPFPRDDKLGDILGQSQRSFDGPNYAMAFYLTQYCGHAIKGKFNKKTLGAVPGLGLAIWDTERLAHMGLAPLPPNLSQDLPLDLTQRAIDSQLHIWRSMFIQEIKRKQNMESAQPPMAAGPQQLIHLWSQRASFEGIKFKKCHTLRKLCSVCQGSVTHKAEDCWYRDPTGNKHQPVYVRSEPFFHNQAAWNLEHSMDSSILMHEAYVAEAEEAEIDALLVTKRNYDALVPAYRLMARCSAAKLEKAFADFLQSRGSKAVPGLNDQSNPHELDRNLFQDLF